MKPQMIVTVQGGCIVDAVTNSDVELFIHDLDNSDGKCDHRCSGDCRRNGCNCDCGEWHEPLQTAQTFLRTNAEMSLLVARGTDRRGA